MNAVARTRRRLLCVASAFALGLAVIGCGEDDPSDADESAAEPDAEDAESESEAEADQEPGQAAADSEFSPWYTDDLDDLGIPAAGAAVLELPTDEAVELDVRSCRYLIRGGEQDGAPEQDDDVLFQFSASADGELADGRQVSVSVTRTVNPEGMGGDPYESDLLLLNLPDHSSTGSAATRSLTTRAEPGGPVEGDGDDLPMLRLDPAASAVTFVGETVPMPDEAGADSDEAIEGDVGFAASLDC